MCAKGGGGGAREDLHQCSMRVESRMCAGGGGRRQRGFTYIFNNNLIRNACWRRMKTPERIYIDIQQ